MRPGRSAGTCRWTPLSRGPTSTRPGRVKGDLQTEPPGGIVPESADHGLGRSRGGLATKVHQACEQGSEPLSIVITAGQRGDSPLAQLSRRNSSTPRYSMRRPSAKRSNSSVSRVTVRPAQLMPCQRSRDVLLGDHRGDGIHIPPGHDVDDRASRGLCVVHQHQPTSMPFGPSGRRTDPEEVRTRMSRRSRRPVGEQADQSIRPTGCGAA